MHTDIPSLERQVDHLVTDEYSIEIRKLDARTFYMYRPSFCKSQDRSHSVLDTMGLTECGDNQEVLDFNIMNIILTNVADGVKTHLEVKQELMDFASGYTDHVKWDDVHMDNYVKFLNRILNNQISAHIPGFVNANSFDNLADLTSVDDFYVIQPLNFEIGKTTTNLNIYLKLYRKKHE